MIIRLSSSHFKPSYVCREVKLKGISTPRSSTAGIKTTECGQLTEVTCDKASLTKHEYVHLFTVTLISKKDPSIYN